MLLEDIKLGKRLLIDAKDISQITGHVKSWYTPIRGVVELVPLMKSSRRAKTPFLYCVRFCHVPLKSKATAPCSAKQEHIKNFIHDSNKHMNFSSLLRWETDLFALGEALNASVYCTPHGFFIPFDLGPAWFSELTLLHQAYQICKHRSPFLLAMLVGPSRHPKAME